MARFDSYDYGVRSAHVEAPPPNPFEQADRDAPVRKIKPINVIIAIAAAILLIICLIYTFGVSPATKLKVCLLAQNYKLSICKDQFAWEHPGPIASMLGFGKDHGLFSYSVKVDGNAIAYDFGSGQPIYCVYEDGGVYTYDQKKNSEWVRSESPLHKPIVKDGSEITKQRIWQSLTNPDNYERVSRSPLTWRVKSSVDLGYMSNVRLTVFMGKFIFTWNEGAGHYTMTVDSFLFSRVDLPWE